MPDKIRQNVVNESLQSWELLNNHISDMNETELKTALSTETQFNRRKQFIIRIHARYCKVRNARERADLLAVCQ